MAEKMEERTIRQQRFTHINSCGLRVAFLSKSTPNAEVGQKP
jgi:hypothetical protein